MVSLKNNLFSILTAAYLTLGPGTNVGFYFMDYFSSIKKINRQITIQGMREFEKNADHDLEKICSPEMLIPFHFMEKYNKNQKDVPRRFRDNKSEPYPHSNDGTFLV